jgi:hypothetical protein
VDPGAGVCCSLRLSSAFYAICLICGAACRSRTVEIRSGGSGVPASVFVFVVVVVSCFFFFCFVFSKSLFVRYVVSIVEGV